jgi:hypothetical protein
MPPHRVALYFMNVEADSPEDAIASAQESAPDHAWAAPRPRVTGDLTDSLVGATCWLLEEWAIRSGRDEDLGEQSKIVAAALRDRFAPTAP